MSNYNFVFGLLAVITLSTCSWSSLRVVGQDAESCETNADCEADDFLICVNRANVKTCVPEKGERCDSSSGTPKTQCLNNDKTCFEIDSTLGKQCSACKQDTDCTLNPHGKTCVKPIANAIHGYCGECSTSSDCTNPNAEYCTLTNTCKDRLGNGKKCSESLVNQCLWAPCIDERCGGDRELLKTGDRCNTNADCQVGACGGPFFLRKCGFRADGEKCIVDAECSNSNCSNNVCASPTMGLLADGEQCTSSLQCQSKMCDLSGSTRICGLKKLGQSCFSDADCGADDAVCGAGTMFRTCVERIEDGGRCFRSKECKEGLTCVKNANGNKLCGKVG